SRRRRAPRRAWRAHSCRMRSGPRSRSRPYGRLHRAERVARPHNGVSVRYLLAVAQILERDHDRRCRRPARIRAGDAALVFRRRFRGGPPALARAVGEREEAPVDEPERGRGRPVIARRTPDGRALREERTERGAEREARGSDALQLSALREREPPLAHRPLEENERHENDDDHDDDLESPDDEWSRSFDLAQQCLVVGRLELRRPRREEAYPPKERLEERVHESGEIAEWQQQGEDELVERGRARFAEV